MNRVPLVVVDGIKIRFRGIEKLLILTPTPAANLLAGEDALVKMWQIGEQMGRLVDLGHAILVYKKPDSTLGVVSPPEWKEEIESRTISVSQLEKIPIYQDDLS